MRYGQITFATRLGLPLMALVLAACSGQQPGANPASQRSATLARGALIATVTATGNIQPEAEVRLGFQQAGTVAVVNIKVGDAIKKGEPLAKLDTADLEIGVAQAQSTLAQAQASLMIANANYSRTVEGPRKADLDASEAVLSAAYANYEKVRKGPVAADYSGAEANLLNAEASLRSAQSAYDSQARRNPAGIGASPASVSLEQATNNYNAAKAQYDKLSQGADNAQLASAFQQIQSAKASLERAKLPARQFDLDQADAQRRQAEAQIESARLQIRQAQRRLDQTVVASPVDGIVSVVNLKVGELAGTQPVINVVDNSILRIDVTVDEVDVAKVRVGQDVNVTLDSLPGVEIKGKVDRIAPTSTIVNGVVSYSVRVVLPKSEQALKIGMTANAAVVLDKRDNALLAPNWAIRRDRASGKSFLTLKEADKTREIEVQTGLRNDTVSEIASGASEGMVVVAPAAPNVLGQ